METSLEEFRRRFEQTEEITCEVGDKTMQIIESKEQKEKRLKKSEQSLQNLQVWCRSPRRRRGRDNDRESI